VPPGSIDVHDGHLEDWRRLVPGPSLRPANFFADPTAPRDGAADPGFNLDYHIWLAWSSDGKIYVAIERQDDVFLGHSTPPDDDDLWAYDGSVGIRVDGDHSGGPYVLDAGVCPGCTDAELSERSYSQAQQYAALPAVGAITFRGAGADWLSAPPYADAGGARARDSSHLSELSVTEFYVTAFDSIDRSIPTMSRQSVLSVDKTIGFEPIIPDSDLKPREYFEFHSLAGTPHESEIDANLPRSSSDFVDLVLVGPASTAATETSWGGVKTNTAGLQHGTK